MRARRQALELERVRRDADQIRARCIDFSGFVREAWHVLEPATQLRWGWHLDCICEHVQALTRGTLNPRAIFNVPPGCSKSTLLSVMWQAWEWGPCGLASNRFVSTSYDLKNVTRDTRKTRDLVQSEWFQTLWPLPLKREGETSFENYHTGTREGVAFSGITGKRGDRFTIDDPHSLDGAESEAERDKAVRRFIEGGQNRLNDQTLSIIAIIMQRLNERDLSGEVLARDLGYEHIMLPMEFEPERRCITSIGWKDPRTYDGELMDPVRFPRAAVELLKKDNDYMWAGQYQQRPAPREGGMFKIPEDWQTSRVVQALPGPAQFRVRGWDIAGSTKKKSPYTAGGRQALCGKIVYIEDMARARAEIDKAEALIVDTAREDGRGVLQDLPQDPGQAGKSQKFHLASRLMGLEFSFSPETGTKEDRAIPFASAWNAGIVRLVAGPWNSALIEEMRNFPSGAYKDQIDSLSRGFARVSLHMGQEEAAIGAPIYVSALND